MADCPLQEHRCLRRFCILTNSDKHWFFCPHEGQLGMRHPSSVWVASRSPFTKSKLRWCIYSLVFIFFIIRHIDIAHLRYALAFFVLGDKFVATGVVVVGSLDFKRHLVFALVNFFDSDVFPSVFPDFGFFVEPQAFRLVLGLYDTFQYNSSVSLNSDDFRSFLDYRRSNLRYKNEHFSSTYCIPTINGGKTLIILKLLTFYIECKIGIAFADWILNIAFVYSSIRLRRILKINFKKIWKWGHTRVRDH